MSERYDNDYIDPKFEQPWIQSGTSLEENILLEREGIIKVRKVIENFVAEMARRRKGWKAEYDHLRQEFTNTTRDPLILSPFRRKRFHRYKNLKRILGDLPKRQTFATRDVHRKTHGCLAGTFKVRDDLEPDLAKGLFGTAGATYDAVIRFSSGNPKGLKDYAPDARGMAVKLLPQGTLPHDDNPKAIVKQWLADHQGQQIDPVKINRQGLLDVVTINFPVFFVNRPPVYKKVNEFFLNITNNEDARLEHKLSDLIAVFFRGMNKWERELALNVNGSIIYNPLYQKYYSMAPSRLGERSDPDRTAVKYLWEPCVGERYDELIRINNPPWADLHEYAHPLLGPIEKLRNSIPPEVKKNRNHLRMMVAQSLDPRAFEQDSTRPPVCFELKVQKYIDDTQTPIEDTTMIWLESEAQRKQWRSKHKMPKGERKAVNSREIATFRTIGTLTLSPLPMIEIEPAQAEDVILQTRNHRYCEDLSFNPWNNVRAAHRPLGIVQRMKREVYAGSRHTRFQENQIPDVFPR
jgi:hypothetical protein